MYIYGILTYLTVFIKINATEMIQAIQQCLISASLLHISLFLKSRLYSNSFHPTCLKCVGFVFLLSPVIHLYLQGKFASPIQTVLILLKKMQRFEHEVLQFK